MDPWDPSLPGAGAQRAVLLVQLYMRMGHYSPLAVLVADALALTFKSNGATVSELSAHLGLSLDRVEMGICGIPIEMRCTSADLGVDNADGEETKPRVGVKRKRQENAEESTLRYYINYTAFLSFAYAHGTHLLLALCQLSVPHPTTSSTAVWSGDFSSLNISSSLRRAERQRGLCCTACRYWMALKDLQTTVSRCPVCQSDVLGGILAAVRSRYDEKLSGGMSLVQFGPTSQRTATTRAAETDQKGKEVATETVDYPLARDPFLVQQGIFFLFLYSSRFVCVHDGNFVVDADEVMTGEEYTHRARHKATVLDQFRLVHRNTNTIRVKLLNQAKVDAEKYHLSALKVAKRSQLPPWLRPTLSLDELERTDEEEHLEANVHTEQKSSLPQVAEKRKGSKLKETDLTIHARFIAREFFDDDYDEVPLRAGAKGDVMFL